MRWQQDLAKDQAAHFAHLLADGGPGWYPYVLDAAERLVRSDPMTHAGLVARVESAIDAKELPKVHKALEWFRKHP